VGKAFLTRSLKAGLVSGWGGEKLFFGAVDEGAWGRRSPEIKGSRNHDSGLNL